MRVLLATDGSDSSAVACDLVGSMAWPEGSSIRVIAVSERPVGIIPTPWLAPGPGDLGELYAAVVQDVTRALDATEAMLTRPGITVQTVRREGRAASVIVDEARDFMADVVVLGSRGHGTITTMLIGSTSAEVTDHAPCPVLVARTSQLGSVLFADDGSESSERAREVLEAWAPFADAEVAVLSVADVSGPWTVGIAPTMYDDVLAAHAADRAEANKRANAIAHAGAEGLVRAGRQVEALSTEGDAAHRILDIARERGAGLIVIGSRGRTGIVRAMLGSVARNVLLHAKASVLIVR